MGATLIVMTACTEDGINPDCTSGVITTIGCAEVCIVDPEAALCSSSSLDENPELKKAIDSIRVVSKLPVRE